MKYRIKIRIEIDGEMREKFAFELSDGRELLLSSKTLRSGSIPFSAPFCALRISRSAATTGLWIRACEKGEDLQLGEEAAERFKVASGDVVYTPSGIIVEFLEVPDVRPKPSDRPTKFIEVEGEAETAPSAGGLRRPMQVTGKRPSPWPRRAVAAVAMAALAFTLQSSGNLKERAQELARWVIAQLPEKSMEKLAEQPPLQRAPAAKVPQHVESIQAEPEPMPEPAQVAQPAAPPIQAGRVTEEIPAPRPKRSAKKAPEAKRRVPASAPAKPVKASKAIKTEKTGKPARPARLTEPSEPNTNRDEFSW